MSTKLHPEFVALIRELVGYVVDNPGVEFVDAWEQHKSPVLAVKALEQAKEWKLLNIGQVIHSTKDGKRVTRSIGFKCWPTTKAVPFITGEYDPIKREPILLDDTDVAILRYLNESPTVAKSQEDIAAGAEADRKTVGACLARLRKAGYVSHPEGKKRKDAITKAGVERLNLVDAAP